ncbi:MAG: glycosyltransferase family 4 protein [Anaerolineaceae bacterium]|nr:glycosyltransferase family 4 protein [Anaerolineaceae bacterium]
MKILISSTYFYPYSSGLSVYALRLMEGLADLGHEVVVLTSQYKKELPLSERFGKALIVRVPVAAKVSKGVLMPTLPKVADQLIEWADVVNIHLPQFEGVLISRIAKKKGKPILATYHCDLVMKGALNKIAGSVTTMLGKEVLKNANLIVQNSLDYAENSPVLMRYLGKIVEVPTPIKVQSLPRKSAEAFRHKFGIKNNEKVIGLAGRVATEKGFEYLVMAMPAILAAYPQARVIHAGSWKSVIGEEKYQKLIERFIHPLGDKWEALGYLNDEDFEAFFAACDVLVFSSLNATESFGIVQIEAMAQGTPVVASDLPGVRQPVLQTGLGKLVPLRDSDAIAQAVIEILNKGKSGRFIPSDYLVKFQQAEVAKHYESLISLLVNND